LAVVGIAVALNCAFYYIPALQQVPSGISISICAIVSAVAGAILFPIKSEESEGDEQ
jgi:hypothetical protein